MTHIPDEAVQAAKKAVSERCKRTYLTSDQMFAALAAALPHLPLGFEVKKLEWADPSAPNADCSYDHAFSDTSIGKYQIEWKSWKKYDAYVLYLDGDYITSEIDLPTAKDAAQADFERRILSCVATKPVDVAAVRRQAFEEGFENGIEQSLNALDAYDDITRNEAEQSIRKLKPDYRALSAGPVQGCGND